MAKIFLTFIVVYTIIVASIEIIRSMSKLERWSLVKTMSYSALISAISIVIISVIVILF